MSYLARLVLASACFAAPLVASANAVFDYTYRFTTGDIASGSFSGVASGNLVTDISDVSYFINGVASPYGQHLSAWSFTIPQLLYVPYDAVVSFDGTLNNLMLVAGTDASGVRVFESVPQGYQHESHRAFGYGMQPGGTDWNYATSTMPQRWTLTEREDIASVAVPEPAPWALMSLALGALVWMRRRAR
jgi:hypothetical protein